MERKPTRRLPDRQPHRTGQTHTARNPGEIDEGAVGQVLRYKQCIDDFFWHYKTNSWLGVAGIVTRFSPIDNGCIIVAPSFTKEALKALQKSEHHAITASPGKRGAFQLRRAPYIYVPFGNHPKLEEVLSPWAEEVIQAMEESVIANARRKASEHAEHTAEYINSLGVTTNDA